MEYPVTSISRPVQFIRAILYYKRPSLLHFICLSWREFKVVASSIDYAT